MISSEDIEAWREDEKQTQFQEEQRRKADNHVGWEVQYFDKRWKTASLVGFKLKEHAIQSLVMHERMWPQYEFRVYEIVKEKK